MLPVEKETISNCMVESAKRGYCFSLMVFPSRVVWYIHSKNGIVANGRERTDQNAGEAILYALARLPLEGGHLLND
ncbi:TPA_asm: hypothetical protein vir530_00020 [dsDNA virus vir530]|jgi:hypothetical protein|nr:TPA_asm: hypothetical protein vir530_00020 [dsDNA virus vir530]